MPSCKPCQLICTSKNPAPITMTSSHVTASLEDANTDECLQAENCFIIDALNLVPHWGQARSYEKPFGCQEMQYDYETSQLSASHSFPEPPAFLSIQMHASFFAGMLFACLHSFLCAPLLCLLSCMRETLDRERKNTWTKALQYQCLDLWVQVACSD